MIKGIEIQGIREILAKNKELNEKLDRQTKRKISMEAGNLVSDMKKRVPIKEGILRDSIKAKIWKDETGVIGIVAGPKDRSEFRVGKDKKSYYPASQEYGWTAKGRHYTGHPFIRPAFQYNKHKIKNKIGMLWKTIIEGV